MIINNYMLVSIYLNNKNYDICKMETFNCYSINQVNYVWIKHPIIYLNVFTY